MDQSPLHCVNASCTHLLVHVHVYVSVYATHLTSSTKAVQDTPLLHRTGCMLLQVTACCNCALIKQTEKEITCRHLPLQLLPTPAAATLVQLLLLVLPPGKRCGAATAAAAQCLSSCLMVTTAPGEILFRPARSNHAWYFTSAVIYAL
jgi:hypothetical protein